MAHDELIHEHTNTVDLLETNFTIVFVLEDVVVATNEDLATVHTLYQFEILLVDYHVAKKVDSVLIFHFGIVAFNHGLVHLFCRGERTQRTAVR